MLAYLQTSVATTPRLQVKVQREMGHPVAAGCSEIVPAGKPKVGASSKSCCPSHPVGRYWLWMFIPAEAGQGMVGVAAFPHPWEVPWKALDLLCLERHQTSSWPNSVPFSNQMLKSSGIACSEVAQPCLCPCMSCIPMRCAERDSKTPDLPVVSIWPLPGSRPLLRSSCIQDPALGRLAKLVG